MEDELADRGGSGLADLEAATGQTASTPNGELARFSAAVSTWIGQHTTAIALFAAVMVLAVAATAVRHRMRQAPRTGDGAPTTQDCCPPTSQATAATDQSANSNP